MISTILLLFLAFNFITASDDSSKLKCGKLNSTIPNPAFPVVKAKAEIGSNYEITLRSTNRLKNNETSKYVEKFFNGTLVLHKWTREMEKTWYNHSILYEDNFHLQDGQHMMHNRTCRRIQNPEEGNSLGLSSNLREYLHIDGSNFGQLLAKLVELPGGYNATLYDVPMISGVEMVGWLGCVGNWSEPGLKLQVDVRFAGDKTVEQPYSPYWTNPIVYSTDLTYIEVTTNGTLIHDSLSFEMVTLDRVHLADAEFSIVPPRGVHCEQMKQIGLPVQFPMQFLAHIYTTNPLRQTGIFKTTNNLYFYDAESRIVAYSPALFQSGSNDQSIIIHDFTYGFQYMIANNGSCVGISGIDPTAPDVTEIPEGHERGNSMLFMLQPEETLIWRGRRQKMAANQFYYVGKVKSSETSEPLALFSTLRPANRLQWSQRDQIASPTPNSNQLVELLFQLDTSGDAVQFHSIVGYNDTNGGASSRMETQQIHIASDGQEPPINAWRFLHTMIRPCIQLKPAHQYEGNETVASGTGEDLDGNLYVQLAKVTFAQVKRAAGLERANSAVAEALAIAANISQLRIVDLQLKEMHLPNDGEENVVGAGKLIALFSIGKPTDKNVKPAHTAYQREEITVRQAAELLNATIQTGKLQIRIPLKPKEYLNITVRAFGFQSSLYPGPPEPSPTPQPSPPTPSFVGYSGTALAICTVFAFILGAGVIIGAYVFHQKRQHIRGFAYQVFE